MFKFGRILSFIATFIIAGLLLYTVSIGYAVFSKPWWSSGVWLHQFISNAKMELALGFVATVVLIVIAMAFFKRQRPAPALGVVFAGVIFIVSLSVRSWEFFKGQKFDQNKWDSSVEKPFSMTRTLLREKVLVGLDSSEIRQRFGSAFSTNDDEGSEQIKYAVEGNWELVLLLDEGVVLVADIRR